MKLIRVLNIVLIVAAALAATLVVASFSPLVQTWAAGRVIGRQPGLSGSLDWFSAGFGKAGAANVRLSYRGAVLTLPSVKARLPVAAALSGRGCRIESLEAADWTLDVTKVPRSVFSGATPALAAARIVCAVLRSRDLPVALSVGEVKLEGDVLAPGAPGLGNTRTHVVIRGGGLAAGREGTFTIEATSGDQAVAARGTLLVGLDTPRHVSRMEIRAAIPVGAGYPAALAGLDADVVASRGRDGEAYALGLAREGRTLLSALARYPEATRRLEGTWKLDLRDSDLALLGAAGAAPGSVLGGEGEFGVESDFSRVRARGRLMGNAGSLGPILAPLAGFGPVSIGATFDAIEDGRTVRFGSAQASIEGDGLSATLQSTGAFSLTESTGAVSADAGDADWMRVSVRRIDLARLPAGAGGGVLAAGAARGAFMVSGAGGHVRFRATEPLVISDVEFRGLAGRLPPLELSGMPRLEMDSDGWRASCPQAVARRSGATVASLELTAARAGDPDQPPMVHAKGSADLGALESLPAIRGLVAAAGSRISGELAITLGPLTDIQGSLVVGGTDRRRSIGAKLAMGIDGGGGVTFGIPLRISTAEGSSEITVEGSGGGDAGGRVDVRVSGGNVSLDHLRVLMGVLATTGGGGQRAIAGVRDRSPFWGDWSGQAHFSFDRVSGGPRELSRVEGTIECDPGSIRATGFRCELPGRIPVTGEAAATFDSAAGSPYGLTGRVAVARSEPGEILGKAPRGEDPGVEGHFSVERTFRGRGLNAEELISGRSERIRITSTAEGGIFRMLKAGLGDVLPEKERPVSDTLGTVGSAVGSLFGVRKDSDDSGRIKVGKKEQAVLDCADVASEIGYDRIALEVVQGPTGDLKLASMELVSPDIHLVGTGRIEPGGALPFTGRTIEAELTLGAKGRMADLLSTAGLLSKRKDALGYALLEQPLRFGGTLAKLDRNGWQDLLAGAAAASRAAP